MWKEFQCHDIIMGSYSYKRHCKQISNNNHKYTNIIPDSKVHGANMVPTWVLSAPDGPHVGPMNIAISDTTQSIRMALFCFALLWLRQFSMMTSSNGNIFRVTGPLCWEFTGPRGALIYAWINDWVNNREAGDLRRHRAHYEVIEMQYMHLIYYP